MPLILRANPSIEPVTAAEARAHLRLAETGEEETIAALITAARQEVERQAGQVLIEQRWCLALDGWPQDGPVLLRLGPVRKINTVTVFGADGAASLLPASAYRVDALSAPARVVFFDCPLPGVAVNGIEIDYRCGYGPSRADVPERLKRAVLMLVAHWYEFRGAVDPAGQPVSWPAGFGRLVESVRPVRLD